MRPKRTTRKPRRHICSSRYTHTTRVPRRQKSVTRKAKQSRRKPNEQRRRAAQARRKNGSSNEVANIVRPLRSSSTQNGHKVKRAPTTKAPSPSRWTGLEWANARERAKVRASVEGKGQPRWRSDHKENNQRKTEDATI